MRILFVTASYPPESVGGVELHVAGLARAMTAAGHACSVLARTGRPGLRHLQTARETVDGIEVVRLANTFEDATTFQAMYAHAGLADAFARELLRVQPDVVHIHHLTCLSTLIVERCRRAGVPVVMTLHDFWMGCPRGQRITAGLDLCPTIRLEKCLPCLRELWPHLLGRGVLPDLPAEERDSRDLGALEQYHAAMRATLSSLDMLFTPSEFMRRMYLDYGVPGSRLCVVENGLPRRRWALRGATPARSGSLPARPGAAGPMRIGFIGSVLPSKGVHLLIEAFRRLGDPTGLRLDIWGEVLPFHNDRGYGDRLAALRRGFEAAITLHGRYDNDDVPAMLAGLDVVVVPSIWYEAFGLTIREAFLAGVPVVAANHGAMAEAVEDGRTGLLFQAGDAASLAEALRRLADHPELRAALAGGPAWVRDEQEAAAQLLGLYDQALAGRAPGPAAPGDRA